MRLSQTLGLVWLSSYLQQHASLAAAWTTTVSSSSSVAWRRTSPIRRRSSSSPTMLGASISPPAPTATSSSTRATRPSSSPSTAADGDDTTFSATAAAAAAGITWDWQAVAQAAFCGDDSHSTAPIVLFDGVCNFCTSSVHVCLDLDDDCVLRFCSLQSKTGQALLLANGRHPDDVSSIVLVTAPTVAYFESCAVLKMAQLLTGLPRSLRQIAGHARRIVPPAVRNHVYQLVSSQRQYLQLLTTKDDEQEEGPTCRMDFDGTLHARFVQDPEDL